MFNCFSQAPLIQQSIEIPIDRGSDSLGKKIQNINKLIMNKLFILFLVLCLH